MPSKTVKTEPINTLETLPADTLVRTATEEDASDADVYSRIAAVIGDLAKLGIAKSRSNDAQHFKFRGIDDVYNALSPLLAKHQLVIIPFTISREEKERVTKSGGTLFQVTLCIDFRFVSAIDNSWTTARIYGEAMDSGDKATNKAMSAAYKYAALMTFAIPTEGDNDADATTPEPSILKAPEGFEDWFADMLATVDEGVDALKRAWFDSPEPFREYAQTVHGETWTAAKKKSAAIDAAKRQVEA